MQSPFGVLSREESIRWLQELLGTDLAPLFRLLSLPGESPSGCDARVAGLTLSAFLGLALAARVAPGPAHPWLGAVLAAAAVLWIFAAVPGLVRAGDSRRD